MSCYKINYSKSAEKFIRKNKLVGIRFMKAFMDLAKRNDDSITLNIKKFHSADYDDIFRMRIGDDRAIFRVIGDEILILVVYIGSRGGIYK